MKFLWVKLHIEFAFHHRDPYGSGVVCPWIFYKGHMHVTLFWGIFLHRFIYIGTWNFPWSSSQLSYTSSSHFIIMTPMVPELRALGFYACNSFLENFSTPFHIGTWNFQVKLHIEFTFHCLDPYGSRVMCPWIFYYRTCACTFSGVFFYTVSHRNLKLSSRFSVLSYTSSSHFIIVTPMVLESSALGFFLL
jgi:hypothetical protein